MEKHYIYCITNLINGKKYIGKRTCHCDIDKDKYMGSGIAIIQAIKKYGKDSFKKDIIEICDSEEKAYNREREIIESVKAYSNPMYYNIAFGGLGNTCNWKPSKSMIEKGLETKRKNGTMPVGKNNGMYRKYNYSHCSEIVVIPRKGKIVTYPSIAEASRNLKISSSIISRHCVRCKVTELQTDFFFIYKNDFEKITNKDKFVLNIQEILIKNTIKESKKYQIYNKKKIYRINIETLDIIDEYENIHIASKKTNIRSTNIKRNVVHNANCALKGYLFIFADEYNTMPKDNLYKLYHSKNIGLSIPKPTIGQSVYCLTTGQKFDSVKDAIQYFSLSKGTKIVSVCNGERQYAGKHPTTGEPLVWQYYNDYINGIYRFFIPKESKYINKRVAEIISPYK